MTLYWGAAAAFAVCMILALLIKPLFHLEGPAWYLVLGVMAALGVGSAAIFMYLQSRWQARKDAKAAGGAAPGGAPASGQASGTEADHWIREANARLAQSKDGAGIANLPMIFVAGDRGTAKTSTILNSGLEPELLAGQVYQDNVVAPTRGANIFFARDTVMVEAGGTLMAQPSNWKALVAKLEPGRLKGGNGLAPRGVLLCFDLEAFSRQGAADAIANAARYLQERLGEVSQVLGISYPVYVLFTRADRLPFFADYVRNLTNDEAGQVVGATLPIRSAAAGGIYAEEETRRLTEAFNQLFYSFCDQRLRLLPRETDSEKTPGAYEFPREFRKLRNLLVQFLVDVGRPSQLRASPFLRGFYFSGVRALETRDIPAPLVAPSPAPAPEMSGATSMFRAGMLAERKSQQAVAQKAADGRGTRRVPQWLFLGHLFHEVILADSAARSASGSSVKTSIVKRILLATAAVLCLFYSAMLLMTFFNNKGLEDTALTAANRIPKGAASGQNLPNQEDLTRLESLRQSLETLTRYKYDGAPFSYRWGLYSGNEMLPEVRRIYYKKFRQLLFGSTQDQMLKYLQTRPPMPSPSDDFGTPYDTLKAYLLTTKEWKRSSDQNLQTFLGDRLLAQWSAGREGDIGKERMDLAKLQFDFYARDLQHENPYSPAPDAVAVDNTQHYLSQFSGFDRVYRSLLAQAAGHPAVSFNQLYSGTSEVVTSTAPVVWAYTHDGWGFIRNQIKTKNFGGEPWVLGDKYQGQAVDPAAMEKGILDRYVPDYIAQWRNVLKTSRVNAYANLADAAKKLTVLTGPGAPLLQLFWWVSQNTGIDAPPGVAEHFASVQAVVPPSTAPQYIVAPNQNYNNGLMGLQQDVGRAANGDPDGQRNWPNSASSATLVTRQLGQSFPNDLEAHLERQSLDLLLQPITNLDNVGAGDLNAAGKGVCDAFAQMTRKFPFNRTASQEVTFGELGDLLRPKTGKLWDTYEKKLKSAMTCENGKCTAKGSPPINPVFLSSEEQLMRFSHALYGDAGTDPNLTYKMRALKSDQVAEFTITVNGQAPVKLKGGEDHSFVFPGPGTPGFKLGYALVGGGNPLGEEEPPSNWAVFRFFFGADTIEPGQGGDTFIWKGVQGANRTPILVGGKQLVYGFFVDTEVFSKNFLSNLSCVSKVTR